MAQEADQVLVVEEPVCLAHWVSCDEKLDKKNGAFTFLKCLMAKRRTITKRILLRYTNEPSLLLHNYVSKLLNAKRTRANLITWVQKEHCLVGMVRPERDGTVETVG